MLVVSASMDELPLKESYSPFRVVPAYCVEGVRLAAVCYAVKKIVL